MDDLLIEEKIRHYFLPKLREVQKSTGIRRVQIRLISEYKYIVYRFVKYTDNVKIVLKATGEMKEKMLEFKKECALLA